MLKVLKNLKNSFWAVVAIVILLCVQAKTDLTLPDYTSKIVNTGIQAGGIETAVPEFISKENMEQILMFSENNDEILDSYTLLGDTLNEKEQKIAKKYFGNDYKIEQNTTYILKEMEKGQKEELETKLSTPLMIMSTINNEETANKILEYLVLHRQQVISRDEIMDYLWESEEFVDDNTLNVNIKRLRTKHIN